MNDTLTDFFSTLISTSNKLSTVGKKLDVAKFMAEYRFQISNHESYSIGNKLGWANKRAKMREVAQ